MAQDLKSLPRISNTPRESAQWARVPWASSGVASFFRFTDDCSQRKSHLITIISLIGPRAVL